MSLEIHSSTRDYQAHFEATPDFIAALATLPHACFAIDENVWQLYRDTLLSPLSDREPILVPIGEALKTLDTVQWLYEQLVQRPEKRNLTIVAFGGGILQDVVGFAASTLYRGVSWIFTPTTLLAQADSCIGSKTSLNFRGFKNLLGTFYPPEQIHIYPPFLETQSTEDYYQRAGRGDQASPDGRRTPVPPPHGASSRPSNPQPERLAGRDPHVPWRSSSTTSR